MGSRCWHCWPKGISINIDYEWASRSIQLEHDPALVHPCRGEFGHFHSTIHDSLKLLLELHLSQVSRVSFNILYMSI